MLLLPKFLDAVDQMFPLYSYSHQVDMCLNAFNILEFPLEVLSAHVPSKRTV